MINWIRLINRIINPPTYIWVDVTLIKETPKAILIVFNGKRAWLPKTWIFRIKRKGDNGTTKIKLSIHNWFKKFQ